MSAENDNEPDTTGPHEPALLAFSVNVEFLKRLVDALEPGSLRPRAVNQIRSWMTLQIDGAQSYLVASEEQEGPSPELVLLARQIADARAWLETLP